MDNYTDAKWPGWETVRLIGRGSYGAVYEIERDLFGKKEKAALKHISIPQNPSDIEEMYSDGYDDESITATFQSHLESIVAEYSLMRKLNGAANIVNCDDVQYIQREDGIGWDIYIKMELLTPLTKALPNPVPEETVCKIAQDMCQALILCKRFDVVHRDIKPQNIFVSPLGEYKLGDFGIAKTVEKTMGGTKIGTYKYMAPEVYNNQPYSQQADIYSLGLVLYWMLNKRRMPFMPLPPQKPTAGMDEQARNHRLSGELLPPPSDGSEGLQRVVLKACAYNPKDRYHTAAEMLEDLSGLNQQPEKRQEASYREEAQKTSYQGADLQTGLEEEQPVGVFKLGHLQPSNHTEPQSDSAAESFRNEEECTIGAFGAEASAILRGQSQSVQTELQQHSTSCAVQLAQQENRQYTSGSAISQQNGSEAKKKKRRISAWIAVAASLVIVIGGILLLKFGKGKDSGNPDDIGVALHEPTLGSSIIETEEEDTLVALNPEQTDSNNTTINQELSEIQTETESGDTSSIPEFHLVNMSGGGDIEYWWDAYTNQVSAYWDSSKGTASGVDVSFYGEDSPVETWSDIDGIVHKYRVGIPVDSSVFDINWSADNSICIIRPNDNTELGMYDIQITASDGDYTTGTVCYGVDGEWYQWFDYEYSWDNDELEARLMD